MKILYEIEEKYKNELENIEEWAYLRNYYRYALFSKDIKIENQINKFKVIKDIFWSLSYWFKSYKYFVFSDTDERKVVEKKWFDKSVDYLISSIGKDKGLLIEEPNPSFLKKKDIYTKNITSRRGLDVIAFILAKIIAKKVDYSILNQINKEYDIKFDYEKQINLFNSRYIIYKKLFKLYKINFVIVNCYYTKQYIIKSANELNIETFEVQHGVINKNNDAYNSILSFNKNYFPNYLLSFGDNEKIELVKNGLINKLVIPVGNFYLDYLNSSFSKNLELEDIISQYKKTVGISLAKGSEDLMINFIINVAKKSKDILYILIPRFFKKEDYINYKFPNNVILYSKLDCYQIIMHCNYHITYYSACAIEAPSLGIANILIDFDGEATLLYKELDGKTSYIVETEKEFLNIFIENNLLNYDIIGNNSFYIKNNYKLQIKNLITKGYFNDN